MVGRLVEFLCWKDKSKRHYGLHSGMSTKLSEQEHAFGIVVNVKSEEYMECFSNYLEVYFEGEILTLADDEVSFIDE